MRVIVIKSNNQGLNEAFEELKKLVFAWLQY